MKTSCRQSMGEITDRLILYKHSQACLRRDKKQPQKEHGSNYGLIYVPSIDWSSKTEWKMVQYKEEFLVPQTYNFLL